MGPEEGIKKLRDTSRQELAARYTQLPGGVCLTRDPKGHTLCQSHWEYGFQDKAPLRSAGAPLPARLMEKGHKTRVGIPRTG